MIQAALDFERRDGMPQWPTASKTLAVLARLMAGDRLTVGTALRLLGVYALSQEVGRLKRLGWAVQSEMIEVSPGVHVKEYWL